MTALEGQVQTLEAENQALQGQIGVLEAESDGELIAIDADGNEIGRVHDILKKELAMSVIALEGIPAFSVSVFRHFIRGSRPEPVYFNSPGCSGIPFFPSDGSQLLGPTTVSFISEQTGTTFVRDDSAQEIQSPNVQSVWDPRSGCFPSGNGGLTFLPGFEIPSISAMFTPPFRVVTRGEFLAMQAGEN
jgi:hypothetical protein